MLLAASFTEEFCDIGEAVSPVFNEKKLRFTRCISLDMVLDVLKKEKPPIRKFSNLGVG